MSSSISLGIRSIHTLRCINKGLNSLEHPAEQFLDSHARYSSSEDFMAYGALPLHFPRGEYLELIINAKHSPLTKELKVFAPLVSTTKLTTAGPLDSVQFETVVSIAETRPVSEASRSLRLSGEI